jgi:Fic family protein
MRFPQTPPDYHKHLAELRQHGTLTGASATLTNGRYLHWDELRRRTPPSSLTVEQWWATQRLVRSQRARSLVPMLKCYGTDFSLVDLSSIQQALHDFDRANVGEMLLSALGSPELRLEYRVRQLIEEAISSSEIEGARPTTRELARQMLRENRPPASRDERMIVNNLRAMERMRELFDTGTQLELSHLLELHRILGDDALDVDGAAGVLRGPEHDVTVSDLDGNVWHRPPDAHGIEARIAALLDFANARPDEPGDFIHPIVRAIVAHFWLAYEHPFRDGNGRMARALYYWCMLRHGYEVAEFLSISGPIDRSPSAYYLAFAYTESDAGDLTYFVLHQLDVMKAALSDLVEHLTARTEHLRALSKRVSSFDELNHRQRSLLEHAVRHPAEGHNIEGHASSHRIHYMTARSDLADLERRGLMQSRRVHKIKRYYPAPELLASATAKRPRAPKRG